MVLFTNQNSSIFQKWGSTYATVKDGLKVIDWEWNSDVYRAC